MTLELSPELESQIELIARQRGMDVPSFALEALRVAAQTATENDQKAREKAERRAILDSLQGRFAGHGPTVDEFLAERSAEGRREANR
jgi:hypothetical protein